jgi:hypothetical protein
MAYYNEDPAGAAGGAVNPRDPLGLLEPEMLESRGAGRNRQREVEVLGQENMMTESEQSLLKKTVAAMLEEMTGDTGAAISPLQNGGAENEWEKAEARRWHEREAREYGEARIAGALRMSDADVQRWQEKRRAHEEKRQKEQKLSRLHITEKAESQWLVTRRAEKKLEQNAMATATGAGDKEKRSRVFVIPKKRRPEEPAKLQEVNQKIEERRAESDGRRMADVRRKEKPKEPAREVKIMNGGTEELVDPKTEPKVQRLVEEMRKGDVWWCCGVRFGSRKDAKLHASGHYILTVCTYCSDVDPFKKRITGRHQRTGCPSDGYLRVDASGWKRAVKRCPRLPTQFPLTADLEVDGRPGEEQPLMKSIKNRISHLLPEPHRRKPTTTEKMAKKRPRMAASTDPTLKVTVRRDIGLVGGTASLTSPTKPRKPPAAPQPGPPEEPLPEPVVKEPKQREERGEPLVMIERMKTPPENKEVPPVMAVAKPVLPPAFQRSRSQERLMEKTKEEIRAGCWAALNYLETHVPLLGMLHMANWTRQTS